MKKLLALSVVSVFIAGNAFAGANPNVNVAVHMINTTKAPTCLSLATTFTSCSVINQSITTAAASWIAVPTAYMFNSFQGIDFGLDWHDSYFVYSPVWAKCSDLEITAVGATSGSFALTWTTCQFPAGTPGVGGKALGTFKPVTTVGMAGRIDVIASSAGNQAMVDCDLNRDDFHTTHAGFVNSVPGPADLAPCQVGPTGTEATTWSGVKALYR